MSYKTYNESLFDFASGAYCGVLVKENIMRRIAKEQAAYLERAKRILFDGASRNEVFPCMWTLHYPGGIQTEVKFIDLSVDVARRIDSATVPGKPKHEPLVFIANSMEEAKSMADARFDELGS